MNVKTEVNSALRWRFDINAFRLIGRELITDRVTAVFELVKNCYDANAENVSIEFYNVSKLNNSSSKIIIRDDGHGMSFADIKDKWMVVGTASKRNKLYSPKPYNRRYVGEKGIGRFAVDKLGGKLKIATKVEGEDKKLNIEINWEKYEELSIREKELTLFTEIDNTYSYEEANFDTHGTELIIHSIHEIWTRKDINRLYRELTKIINPFYPINPPFNIFLYSNEFEDFNVRLKSKIKGKKVIADKVRFASHTAHITYNLQEKWQESLDFNRDKGEIIVKNIPIKSFGPIKIWLYYFDEEAKRRFNREFKNIDERIDGVKIYRDGLITTPFAEFESHPDKKRDILGIDKRLRRDIFNRLNTRDVIGIVNTTKENNPLIIDATNRQDFVDNSEYRELKDFIIKQLDVFAELRKYEREKIKENVDAGLTNANNELNGFIQAIEKLEKDFPNLEALLKPLKRQARGLKKTVREGVKEHKKAQKEFQRKENIYLSLMSLQDYATHISHAVRTSLGKIKRMAEFFMDKFPNQQYDQYFKEYANSIYSEMITLEKVTNFMLSYASSNLDFEEFSIKALVKKVMCSSHKNIFEMEGIRPIVEFRDDFVLTFNKKFFEDVLANLISNSIKALKGRKNKIIKCEGYSENDQFVLLVSDNGEGIPKEIRDQAFDLYFTTTAEFGGAGLGLYIVRTRIEAMKGKVEFIDSEFGQVGSTIKITLPFNKK